MTLGKDHDVNGGTIIHGTLRNEDIIPALLDYLETMPLHKSASNDERMKKVESFKEDFRGKDPESEWAMELCYEIFDAINEYLPEGFYCGALEGDGSDFGVWLDYEQKDWDNTHKENYGGSNV